MGSGNRRGNGVAVVAGRSSSSSSSLGVKEKKVTKYTNNTREKKRMRKLTRKDPSPHIYILYTVICNFAMDILKLQEKKKKRGGVLQ